ncbi:metalloregulator ArsR/SmtB family transcription factor [Spirosoma arcticum]
MDSTTMTTNNVTTDDKRIDKAAYVLKAIAHPLRIKIIQMLNENKELNVSAIYKNLNAEQSLISHHLINMRDKGILDIRRSGKNIYYFLVDSAVSEVIECIYKSKILN